MEEFARSVEQLFAPLIGGVGDAIGDLLFGTGQQRQKPQRGSMSAEEYTRAMREFESRWQTFWNRLGSIAINTMRSILSEFVSGLVGGMARALGGWLARLAGGSGGGGGGGGAGGVLDWILTGAQFGIGQLKRPRNLPASTGPLITTTPGLVLPGNASGIPTGPSFGNTPFGLNPTLFRPAKFSTGGFVPPNVTMPAILHGGSQGELVVPVSKIAEAGRASGPTHVHNWNIAALDGPSFREFLRRGGASEIAFAVEQNWGFSESRISRSQGIR
jgi:hypothetical protein